MDKKEKAELKKMIAAKIKKAEKKVANYEEMTQPIAPENSIGRLSRMDAINNKSVAEAALRKAKQTLSALKGALQKIDHPEFGKCNNCGCAIPKGRIVLKPESPYCVNCAQ